MNRIAALCACGFEYRRPDEDAEALALNLNGMPCPHCGAAIACTVDDENGYQVAYDRGQLDGWDACQTVLRRMLDDVKTMGEALEILDQAIEASRADRAN